MRTISNKNFQKENEINYFKIINEKRRRLKNISDKRIQVKMNRIQKKRIKKKIIKLPNFENKS